MGDVISLKSNRAAVEEPAHQTHEEIFASPLGVTVVGVTTTFKDGRVECSVYLDSDKDPEVFECIGTFEDTEEGRTLSKSAVSVVVRTLEALADIAGRAA